jgi:hypothetical protein
VIARFAVDFDGTLVDDDHYPEVGPWKEGASEFLRALEKLGQVVIWTCRTADSHHLTELPKGPDEVREEVEKVRAVLQREGFGHLEIWTKPWKPPAVAYIDNKAVRATDDFEDTLDRVLDVLNPPAKFTDLMKEYQKWMTAEAFGIDEGFAERTGLADTTNIGGDRALTRHPSSERFHEILQELGRLHDEKSIGYGTSEDPLANCRASERWGVPGWVGTMVRASDKVQRLQSFVQKGALPFESIEDNLRDLAVYAVIALVLFEQERGR